MQSVLLIGTGRLAFHLGHALRAAGLSLVGVVGRDSARTTELATEFACPALALTNVSPRADLRILAVSDDAIPEVANMLPVDGTSVIHLSGSKPLDLLTPHIHRGVLWPIQSFSPGSPVSFSDIPMVIDADDAPTLAMLQGLACRLSSTVVQLPFNQRQRLHLSAVLSSNFPVFLLREAERLLVDHGIDPGLVHPLWKASTKKALKNADQAVTGPARRGDVKTIEQQLHLLSDEPDLRRAYAALSDLIFRTYHAHPSDKQDL